MALIKRLVNVKTRRETGFDYVVSALDVLTPFGSKQLKEQKPFFPGQEEELRKELERVERMMDIAIESPGDIASLREIFMVIKDNTFSIERAATSVLSVVEIFELKSRFCRWKKQGGFRKN